jgi:hypothetical protein
MNEIEYERMQESAAIGQAIADNLSAILDDAPDVGALYRRTYKYTECGAWLSVRLHDGSVRHCDQLNDVKNGDVRALLVGSIVENSDAEVRADWIDLLDYETPTDAVKAFDAAVQWVDNEACALWGEK